LIIHRIIELLASYRRLSTYTGSKGNEIFLNNPVLDCLEWCSTFINPPEKITDVDDVVQQIRNEARDYLKVTQFGPFSTIEGCI